jgi:hypothetical protein
MTKPIVGMGATLCCPSDKYPYVITRVISDKTIEVCALDTNGVSAWGRSVYLDPATTPIENNGLMFPKRLRLNKRGQWTHLGTPFALGHARYYLAPEV